jgi:VCBS repeat-containing protein
MASASRSHPGILAAPIAALLARLLVPAAALAQGEPVTFSATGDYPYGSSEISELQQHMDLHNLYSPSDFYVHVGDIKSGSESCQEGRFIDVADALKTLAVPAFCLVGDNEWTDCSNQSQAWGWYVQHLANLDAWFCYPWELERQSVRPENWAFVHKGVLFAGINIPNGDGGNQNTRLQHDATWVNQQMTSKKSQVRAAVIFGHAGPSGSRAIFFDQFEASSAAFGKPVLYIMGDQHKWQLDNPWSPPNMTRLIVDRGGAEQPVEITVNMSTSNPWVFRRNPWSGSPSSFDHSPCVDVGPDKTVGVAAPLALTAFVRDDGSTSVLWTKRSGPGTVTFANASSKSTTATFSSAGIYEIRCTATDAVQQSWDELLVTVGTGGGGSFLTITDVAVIEGSSGTGNAVFDVVLSGSPSGSVSVSYATTDSSAQAPSDYTATTGTLTFTSTGTRTVSVPVHGDTQVEPNEVFFVNLSGATNGAIITKSQGRGTIQNDDAAPPNAPPVATADSYVVAEDGTLAVASPGVLANDVDPEGQALTASVVAGPSHGTLSLASNGSFTYTPALNFNVDDTFSYRATDGAGNRDTANVVIDVTPVNDPPVAGDDAWSTGVGATLVVAAPGVLGNDVDVDGASLQALVVTTPAHGSLSLAANGSFTFAPDPGFAGGDAFTYQARDAAGASDVATVAIAIGTPQTATFHPVEDAYVKVSGSSSYGTDSSLRVRGGSTSYNSHLKFDLTGVGSVASAKLRLRVIERGSNATWHATGNNFAGTSVPWQEETLSWAVAPLLGPSLGTVTVLPVGSWVEIDVTAQVPGAGIYSFALAGIEGNSTRFSSKEGANPPELVVTTVGGGGPAPEPDIAVNPASHDFGTVFLGSSASRTFQVRNDGGADLQVTSTTLAGPGAAEFTIDTGGGPGTLAAGATRDVSISFHPGSIGAKSASFRIGSDDPDEPIVDVALAGVGVDVPSGGAPIVLEEVVGGGSTSSNVVSTTGDVTAADTHLYLATIAAKNFRETTAVTGLGLAWAPVVSQCGARGQTGIAIWAATGTPSGNGRVTATLASAPNAAVIIVTRYSGAASIGNVVSANTIGVSGPCSGGTDGTSYSFAVPTAVPDAVVFSAGGLRSKVHAPGTGWTEHLEIHQGSGGSVAGAHVMDRIVAAPGAVTVNGTFDGAVDWAVAAIELRPSPAVATRQGRRGAAAPEANEPGPAAALAGAAVPAALALEPPRPNPFREGVTIEYALPAAVPVELAIYDAAGRLVRRLAQGQLPAGAHEAHWNGRDPFDRPAASGVYFVRLTAGSETRLRKVILAR